ncbi:MAG: peptide ABC transporter substrate-binding protein [Armatimonadetes bacterium]|nr:peptide ABC transporter substrate-binding protein [Armatimonadota bacterium]
MTMGRWGMILAMLVMACTVLPVHGAPGPRKDIVFGNIQEPSSLNPLVVTAATDVQFLPMFTAYSNVRNDRLDLINESVEAVPTIRNGLWKVTPDGRMEVTWKLRRDVRWHDGRPFTADDLMYTWEVYRNPRAPFGARPALQDVESVQRVDAYTIVVRFRRPYIRANALWLGAFGAPLPRHVVEPMVQRAGIERFAEIPYGQDPRATIGTGPFILRSWLKGNEMVFEANPNYHLGRPVLDRVTIRFFTDVNTMVANFIAGSLDAAQPHPGGIPVAQALEVENLIRQGRIRGYTVQFFPAPASEAYWPNFENSHLRDRRVRQALLYASDREGIVQALFRGKQPVAHSYFPPSHPSYLKDIKKYNYEPDRARQLLEEAGWRMGPDGIRRNAAGERLTFVVTSTAGDRTRERVEQILQVQWRDVGIEMVIDNKPVRIILAEIWTFRRRPPDFLNFSHPVDEFSDVDQWWGSWNIAPVGQRSLNITGYRNEEFDRLLRTYQNTLDARERMRLHQQFQRLWAEEVPIFLIYNFVGGAVWRDGLIGFRPLGLSYTPGYWTWNARQWRWAR